MHTSLTILIILTVVILVVILMTSPTCKSVVGVALGQKKVGNPNNLKAIKGNTPNDRHMSKVTQKAAKPSVERLPRPSGEKLRSAARALPTRKPVAATHVSAGPQHINITAPTSSLVSDPKYPTLNGNLLDLFNSTLDVQSEYGLTEEQIDALAKDFKETHLDVKKDEVTRHRSIIRSQLEQSDAKLQAGYQARLTSGKKTSVEETIIAMREERFNRGENVSEPKKSPSKLTLASRK